MKVAIPHWQGRVSPVFDVAGSLLMVDIENGREVRRADEALVQGNALARAQHVSQCGVDVLICGGISRPLEMALTSAGVRVIAQTCGPVEDVLGAFVSGRLTDTAFLMPGSRGRPRRLRARRRRGRPR